MKISPRRIEGPWNEGWALDKHTLSSTYVGEDEYGRPRFDTIRSEIGEANYRLKYRGDWTLVVPLAEAIACHVLRRLPDVDLIVPMPATTPRSRQPVLEISTALGKLVEKPVFPDLLHKAPTGKPLKDLATKHEKMEAIGNSFAVNEVIANAGRWNALVIDDLFHTGASMESACNALRTYGKISKVYVVALTWK